MAVRAKVAAADVLELFRLPCGAYTMALCIDCGGLFPPSLNPRVNGHEGRCRGCYAAWAKRSGRAGGRRK